MDCSAVEPGDSSSAEGRPELTREQEAAVFRAACRRVAAAVRCQRADSTRQLLGAAADTPVYGTFVTLRRGGRLRSCCGHLGRRLRLAEALDHSADRAATDDPRFPPIERSELSQLDVDVWILWGPQPVAARGEDRVAAVVVGRHGLQIARGPSRGLLLPGVAVEHHFDARAFLEQVCVKAGLPRDAWKADDTELAVFEGRAIEGPFELDLPDGRQPAVAGGFYPADPGEVERAVEGLFASVAPAVGAAALRRHADAPCRLDLLGLAGGGHVPARGHSRLRDRALSQTPAARTRLGGGAARPLAVSRRSIGTRIRSWPSGWPPQCRAWSWTRRPTARSMPSKCTCRCLADLAPKVRVVGITVGEVALPELLRFGVGMAAALRDMPQRPLLVISSDMNHFADDARTRQLDRLALAAIATLDPEHVYETVRRNRHQHVRHGGVRGGAWRPALARLSAPLRGGRLRHQRRCRRAARPRGRLRGTAVRVSQRKNAAPAKGGNRHGVEKTRCGPFGPGMVSTLVLCPRPELLSSRGN